MPDNPNPIPRPGTGRAGAKDETGLLDVLRLLMQSGKAKTTADLLKYAAQYGAPDTEERLRMLEAEGVPTDLAFDFVSVHLRILAHKRNSTLLAGFRGKKVGLLLPVAPHLAELFVPIAEVSFLQADESPRHGPHHRFEDQVIKGGRACRAKAQEMDALVFEAFREGGRLFVGAATADVLEPKLLPASVKLVAHLRPHRDPDDLEFTPGSAVAFI